MIAAGLSVENACKRAGITEYRYTKWLADLPAFATAVYRARAIIVDRRIDRIAHVAANEPDVNRARLIIDTDKWLASKLIPKVYGDKLDVNVNATIDISEALAAARARVVSRPICDPADIVDGEIVDPQGKNDVGSVDKQSLPPSLPDIFS